MPPSNPLSEPCVMVIFGASGDLTKRLLVPALYNLACDGLLSDTFAVVGVGRRAPPTPRPPLPRPLEHAAEPARTVYMWRR